jgi:hypothetical protein
MSSSGEKDKIAPFPQHEYEAVEKAVMESARGRWFLQEFARRNRAADTQTLLDAIQRLQKAAAGEHPPSAEIISLAEAIKKQRSRIAAIRSDDGQALNDAPALYATIADQAKTAARDLAANVVRLRDVAKDFRAAAVDAEMMGQLENGTDSLAALASSQHVLSQRVAMAMGLLSHVDDRIAAMAKPVETQPVEGRHLRYFRQDEDLFASPPSARPETENVIAHRPKLAAIQGASSRPDVPDASDKKRIFIIRRERSENVEIPLAEDLPDVVA